MKRNRQYQRSLLPSLVVLVFAGLYLLFSVGVLKATHFCMGREASIAYFTSEARQCACAIFSNEVDPCCDDQQDLLKIDDFQKSLPVYQLSAPVLTFLGALYSFSLPEDLRTTVSQHPALEVQPPPRLLYEIYCSFVFYGKRSIV